MNGLTFYDLNGKSIGLIFSLNSEMKARQRLKDIDFTNVDTGHAWLIALKEYMEAAHWSYCIFKAEKMEIKSEDFFTEIIENSIKEKSYDKLLDVWNFRLATLDVPIIKDEKPQTEVVTQKKNKKLTGMK